MGTIAKYQCAKDYNICDSFIDFLKCGSRGIYIYFALNIIKMGKTFIYFFHE